MTQPRCTAGYKVRRRGRSSFSAGPAGSTESRLNFEAHKFLFFPLCRRLRRSQLTKKRNGFPLTERGRSSLLFCTSSDPTIGQCLLISMAKEYVGYSGAEPSSPGHVVAAVTWEGKENVQAVSATSGGPFSAASKSIAKGVLRSKRANVSWWQSFSVVPGIPIPTHPLFSCTGLFFS